MAQKHNFAHLFGIITIFFMFRIYNIVDPVTTHNSQRQCFLMNLSLRCLTE